MSDEIKPGDLVMIVKPTTCCGNIGSISQIFTVGKIHMGEILCGKCGAVDNTKAAVDFNDGAGCEIERLIKIDPPSEGDSLPTRADKEITA